MSISVFIFAQIIVFALPSRIILLQIPQGKVIPNYDKNLEAFFLPIQRLINHPQYQLFEILQLFISYDI